MTRNVGDKAAAFAAAPGSTSASAEDDSPVTIGAFKSLLTSLEARMQTGLEQVVRQVVRQELATSQKPISRGFSEVGSTEAEGVLRHLGFLEENGNLLDPISPPNGSPACPAFDYSNYPKEDEGTPALLQHHQEQLQKFDIMFGQKGGFQMYDLHTEEQLYNIMFVADGPVYKGGVDGCLAPWGLMPSSSGAAAQCRISYEHKQTPAQRAAYFVKHPHLAGAATALEAAEGTGTGEPLKLTGAYKGQAVTSMLAAYAFNAYPLIMDLTDGAVHHMLQLHDGALMVWQNLTPQQAYYKQAQLLKSYDNLAVKLNLRLTEIPESLQPPHKKLRELRDTTLIEQLDAVVPFEDSAADRVRVAYELITAWGAGAPVEEMPASVRQTFA